MTAVPPGQRNLRWVPRPRWRWVVTLHRRPHRVVQLLLCPLDWRLWPRGAALSYTLAWRDVRLGPLRVLLTPDRRWDGAPLG